MRSVLERTSSCKLAKQAGRRYLVAWDASEVGKELAQTTGLSILYGSFRHLFQDRHHLVANHAKFIKQGTVEGCIGKALEGEYPLLLACTDAWSTLDGFDG